MAIKNGIRYLLLAEPSVTSLCGAQTVGNVSTPAIFIQTPVQGFKPTYIVISKTGHDPAECLDGTYGIGSTDIDIDCLAYTETKADALAKAVKTAFQDYRGAAGPNDYIEAVHLDNENDFENQDSSGVDLWRYAVTLSFSVQHKAV